MELFGGILAVKSVVFLTFSVFAIAAIGYAVGKITIKGINLGTAGVFIIALLYGCLLYGKLSGNLTVGEESFSTEALKIVENMGLIFFVTSVGFIAGPNFCGNLKRNFKSYVMLGLVIIAAAAGTCVACILIGAGNPLGSAHEHSGVLCVEGGGGRRPRGFGVCGVRDFLSVRRCGRGAVRADHPEGSESQYE